MISDKNKLDNGSLEFLQVVDENGGKASTREIREESELSKNQIHYRYDKLERLGYVEIERVDAPDRWTEMKQAKLTDKARQAIAEGLLVQKKAESDDVSVAELEDRIDEIEKAVNETRQVLNGRVATYIHTNRRVLEAIGVDSSTYARLWDGVDNDNKQQVEQFKEEIELN